MRNTEIPDSGEKEKVKSTRAHDKAGPECVLLEPVGDDPHDGQQNLRGGPGAQRHQHQVGHGAIPDWNLQTLLFTLRSRHLHCLGLGCDRLDGAHEDVGDDVDSHEAVDQTSKVEDNSELPGPIDFNKEREEDSLLRADILGFTGPGCL